LLTHIAAMESVSLYADELLTAFLELEAAIRGFLISDVKYLLYRGALPESLAEIKQISS